MAPLRRDSTGRQVHDAFADPRPDKTGSAGGGGGAGTVTAVTAGVGLTGTPNPIVGAGTIDLADTAVTPATYGSATKVGQFTVDQQGRLTFAADVIITGTAPGGAAGGDLTGTYPNPTLADADLIALRDLAATAGLLSRSGAGAFVARTLTAPAAGITVSNGTGAAGNPTLALANDLAALEAMSGTGLVARTASETYAQRTLTSASTGAVTIADGDGIAGNPTLTVDADLVEIAGVANVRGDLLVTNSGPTWVRLALGAADRFLGSDGTDAAWTAPAALTKVDDTNVTLTLGGTPTTALLRAASLTLGWTGQLAVARGGTGIAAFGTGVATWLGAPSSANLATAITDETGSGALVFATSPTFVTPILGTPTSGTLTNCTIPVGGVTGLGTSVGTFLATPSSANLAAALTDETGTGVAVFGTSPTFTTGITTPAVTGSGGLINAVDELRFRTGFTTLSASATSPFAAQQVFALTVTGAFNNVTAIGATGTIDDQSVNTYNLFNNALILSRSTNVSGGAFSTITVLRNTPTLQSNALAITSGQAIGFQHLPAYAVINAGTIAGMVDGAVVCGLTVGASTTVATRRGVWFNEATGAGAVTNQIALDVDAMTKGGTLNAAVRSAIAAASTNYFLRDTGGAQSSLVGKFTTYNNTTTAGFGVATIVAAGRSTAQTAAVASVAAFTVGAADGTFRVSANVRPTTSTVHAFTVTVTYTDEGSTSRTLTLNFFTIAGGVTATSSVANAAGTVPYEGIPVHIRAKASTAITVATTGTFTTVTYNVEAIIEQLA